VKRWHRAVALALALGLINAATQMVIRANVAAGIYPPDTAIDIPILTTLYVSLFFVPWLALLAIYSRFDAIRRMRPALAMTGVVVIYLPAVVFALGGIQYWAAPHHFAIAGAYAALLVLLTVLGRDDLRTLRGDAMPAAAAAAANASPLISVGQYFWYAVGIALFLYALPFVHNLGCIELPFGSGYDLALLYLGLPAVLVAIFGGRWMAARIKRPALRVGALVVGAGLFVWLVVFGQAYIVLANALLSPQQRVTYEAVVVEKLSNNMLRVRPVAATNAVMSMEVNEQAYARLKVGDRVAKPMVIGALEIPYVARCRWLPFSRRGM